MAEVWQLAFGVFALALLYSSVGHGGGSGYLAAFAFWGLAAGVMRPAALLLNLIVAGIASAQFARAGYFSWRRFWPFAAASAPLAFIGGRIHLPGTLYKQFVGATLIFAAARLFIAARADAEKENAAPTLPLPLALLIGGVLGFVAGLTGVGGGIFLSPLLLLFGWAGTRQTSALSAAFIWVNSAAGLAGQTANFAQLPRALWLWALAALAGGAIGAELGRKRLDTTNLRRLLALALVIAGLKLVFGG
jgi:hypothetical protein